MRSCIRSQILHHILHSVLPSILHQICLEILHQILHWPYITSCFGPFPRAYTRSSIRSYMSSSCIRFHLKPYSGSCARSCISSYIRFWGVVHFPLTVEKSEIATFRDPPRSDCSEKSGTATFRNDLGSDASGRSGLEADPWFPKSRKSRK